MGKKPYRIIILVSALLSLTVYLLNVYVLDSVKTILDWKYRIIDLLRSFFLCFLLFVLIFSGIYWGINKIKAFVKKLP